MTKPDIKSLHTLLPFDPNSMEYISTPYVVRIQVSIFNCGGVAISMCTSHKFIDGHTSTMLLKAWAATARGQSLDQVYPSFLSPSLFCQNPTLPKDSSLAMWPFRQGKFVTRRFVFDVSYIVALKVKASDVSPVVFVENSTCVVVITALLWKCVIAVSKTIHGSEKPSVLSLPVNIRRKSLPPLPESSVGNII
ncbi:unnamed protein product [Ilex paraguariensis]|uniref:Uncharacterized protein n=1 Tax=Ilex paraguariensis TaxID=185542 RepID=A0ABC8UMG4_9AQUA